MLWQCKMFVIGEAGWELYWDSTIFSIFIEIWNYFKMKKYIENKHTKIKYV